MRPSNGLNQMLWLNRLGKNLCVGPLVPKAVVIAVAGAKNRFNLSFPEQMCRRKNEMRAQVHIEDSTSHGRCFCQSDRICSRFHRPKNICPGVFEQPHHIKSENDIILSNQNTAAKQRLRFSFRHF